MSPAEVTIGLVLAAGAAALLLRVFSSEGRDERVAPRPEAVPSREAAAEPDLADLEADEAGEAVAITSEGWAFLPDGEAVHLVPPGEPEDVWPVRATTVTDTAPTADPEVQVMSGRGAPVNPRTGHRMPGWRPGEHLAPGDLAAARVTRGAPDYDPWRLEALGRDREYRSWSFETEDAARAALDLLEGRIVRPPLDEDGEPRRAAAEDYAAARREQEEIERALAMEPDEPEPGEPGS
jgi:hypothetical protein